MRPVACLLDWVDALIADTEGEALDVKALASSPNAGVRVPFPTEEGCLFLENVNSVYVNVYWRLFWHYPRYAYAPEASA